MPIRTRKRRTGRRRNRRSASDGTANAPPGTPEPPGAPPASPGTAPAAPGPATGLADRANGAPPASPAPPTAAASPPGPAAPPGSPLRTALKTWPRKLAAAIAAALVASGTSYFLGADFWRGVEEKVGTADAAVEATTITDIDRFDSDVVHIPEFVVPRPIGRIPAPPNGDSPEGRYRWAHDLGGVDASSTLTRVTITGAQSTPVILQGLRVRVDERRPPLPGSHLGYFGVGAPQSVRYVEVDLSADPPTWRFIGQEGEPEEHFPLRVSASETEVFDVQAVKARGDVSWHLELEYTADGEQDVLRIDDHGQPFRTTETDSAGQDFYGWLDGRWTGSER
jgi:hypothetical protein